MEPETLKSASTFDVPQPTIRAALEVLRRRRGQSRRGPGDRGRIGRCLPLPMTCRFPVAFFLTLCSQVQGQGSPWSHTSVMLCLLPRVGVEVLRGCSTIDQTLGTNGGRRG